MTKQCFKCKQTLPLDMFYKHSKMSDGRVNKCKECNKLDVRENRAAKIDYYKEYDKARANNPNRVSARAEYSKNQSGIDAHKRAHARWIEINIVKRAAHIIVGNSVRDGKLLKPICCECCGVPTSHLEGHHADYAKPLEVNWLCSKCHRAWHKINQSVNG